MLPWHTRGSFLFQFPLGQCFALALILLLPWFVLECGVLALFSPFTFAGHGLFVPDQSFLIKWTLLLRLGCLLLLVAD